MYDYDSINIEDSMPDSRSLIMPHQSEAITAMTNYFTLEKDIPNRSGLVVMPTGSGKTYTAVNWLLKQGVANGYRVVWLVHRQELVEQTFREFRKQAPILKGSNVKKLRVLPISGSPSHLHMSMASRADVYVCSIASVANKYGRRFIERMLGAAGKRKIIVVVDEAHHSVANNYQRVLNRIRTLNPNMILLGLTATPYRMNDAEQQQLQTMYCVNQNLLENKGMRGYVYEVTLKQLLMSGFLAKPHYEKVNTHIVGEISYNCTPEDEAFFKKYGDLPEKIKRNIAKSSARNDLILQQYLKNKERYGKTIIFAVNQLHAETLCEEFKKAGVRCDFAVSSRPDAQAIIQQFKENKLQVLINVQILTEGSDIPDIQTVFLTRETNSDSLLMQMIGRGLRGVKAGGTEIANIVAFYDTWNTFVHWMDPGKLDVFEDIASDFIEEEEKAIEIAPNENQPEDDTVQYLPVQSEDPTPKYLYMKLYDRVHAAVVNEDDSFCFPVGWYTILDEDCNDVALLVYQSQLAAYEEIRRNVALIENKLNVQSLIEIYFDGIDVKPDESEIRYFLEYINCNGKIPPYFTFQERDNADPVKIAGKMESLFEKDEEKMEWLKSVYDSSAILQQIYKSFFAFKKTVQAALKPVSEPKLVPQDERKGYKTIDNYFNLQELLNEVLSMYPKLEASGLIKISWSKNVVRDWFGLCQRYDANQNLYQITINKLLSSPDVDREVIKYLIFHELLHENGYWNHDESFREREWQYPNSAQLDGFLDSLGIEYNLDEIWKNSVAFEIPDMEIQDNGSAMQSNQNSQDPSNVQISNEKAEGIQTGFKYCRNCGNILPADAKFCDICGIRVNY